MKKKILFSVLSIACITCGSLSFAACDFSGANGGNNGSDNDTTVTYHLNGGYLGDDNENTEDYTTYVSPADYDAFKPVNAKKDTWYLEGWYTDENFTSFFTNDYFYDVVEADNKVDLYAKWTDAVTVTKDNFTEFFTVSSRWNGGGTIGNAGIEYSFTPKMAFNPEGSAESIEISATPILRNNNQTVWTGKSRQVYLTTNNDYMYSTVQAIDSSAAGIEFDMRDRTLSYELVTRSFQLKLLHGSVTVSLDLNGGNCERTSVTVTAGNKLLNSELPAPSKTGYQFDGWYTDAELTEKFSDRLINSNRTLYAKFLKQITLTFHTNGAEEIEPRKYLAGQFMSVYEAPERTGFKFFGWYTSNVFVEANKFSDRYADENDVDLYARWEEIRTITFVTNGGNAKPEIEIADTETPDLGNNPTKSDRVFGGWYTDADCKNKYEPVPVTGDLTLYALWYKSISLDNNSVEQLRQYLDIEVAHEKVTITENNYPRRYLKVTLNVSVKNEYRNYSLAVSGNWRINFSNDSGADWGNYIFNNKSVNTTSGKFEFSENYLISDSLASYEATVFNLKASSVYGQLYIPENEI